MRQVLFYIPLPFGDAKLPIFGYGDPKYLNTVVFALVILTLLVRPDGLFPGHRRFYADDPFGNRLEFLQPISG